MRETPQAPRPWASGLIAELRKLARRTNARPRAAAWAIDTLRDPDDRAAAVITGAEIERLETMLVHARRIYAGAVSIVEAKERHLAELRALSERAASLPSPPGDLEGWAFARGGLERLADPAVRAVVEELRPRVEIAVLLASHAGPCPDGELADAAALAADLFPVGEDWLPVDVEEAVAGMAATVSRDLAYRALRVPLDAARLHVEALAAAVGTPRAALVNYEASPGSCAWSSMTLHTFDRGAAFLGERGVLVVAIADED
jgi:hypothetical protein